jgi:hypothetical protein
MARRLRYLSFPLSKIFFSIFLRLSKAPQSGRPAALLPCKTRRGGAIL